MRAEKLGSSIRREQIARAAFALIAEGGLKAVRIGAIARRVGVTPSAIYRHFAGKDELLEEMIELIRSRLESNLQAAQESKGDALEVLEELLARMVGQIRENQTIPRMIFADDFYLGRPDRKSRANAMIRSFLDRLTETIRRGQREGQIRPELDAQVTSVMFLGLFMPPGILWFLSDGGFDVTRQTREAWMVFRRSIEVERDAAQSRGRGGKRIAHSVRGRK